MGADIKAFLQIDDNTRAEDPPFTNDPSMWDLSDDYGLASGKHYAAVRGVLNQSGISPLCPCRGLPLTGSQHLEQRIDADGPNVSWLTPSEVRQALKHMNSEIELLGRPVQMLLRTLQLAEDLYGHDRVRLVFEV